MIGIKISDKNIIDKHFEEIKNHLCNTKGLKYKYTVLDDWISRITDNTYNLEKVIKAEPKQLKSIIDKVEDVGIDFQTKPLKKNKNSDYEKAQYFLLLYEKFSTREDKHFVSFNALELVNDLDINVCPYCNRNFINNTKLIEKSSNNHYVKRTAQLDHFYPEGKHPYLALSFYNLIPVCGTCNMIKLEQLVGVHPYEIMNTDEHLIFDYSFNNTINDHKVDIYHMSMDFKQNWDVLGLEELYKIHNNYVKDLLFRLNLYNSFYRKDLAHYLNTWNSQNDDQFESSMLKEDFERAIFGNYFLEQDLNKFPLSKLTKDLVRLYR